jgi:predicted amidohydrolase
MPAAVNIALAQLSPRLRGTEANIETMREVVSGRPEADLIVFPELYLSGYVLDGIEDLAVRPDGPELQSIADIARESSTALIFGAPEHVESGVANSAFCVGERGKVSAVYRKVQLFGGDESDAFVAGDELLVVELCGVKIGLMICFDVEFPEVARALARGGAELLVTISANMEPFGNDHAVFCSARALENGLPHFYVNQVGPVGNLNFVGGSTAVSPDGETYAQAGFPQEEILDVSLVFPVKSSEREDYLSELRSPMPDVENVPSNATPRGADVKPKASDPA